MNYVTLLIFALTALTLYVLAAGSWAQSPITTIAGGVLGIILGFTAVYAAMANMINEAWGEVILPMGERKIFVNV